MRKEFNVKCNFKTKYKGSWGFLSIIRCFTKVERLRAPGLFECSVSTSHLLLTISAFYLLAAWFLGFLIYLLLPVAITTVLTNAKSSFPCFGVVDNTCAVWELCFISCAHVGALSRAGLWLWRHLIRKTRQLEESWEARGECDAFHQRKDRVSVGESWIKSRNVLFCLNVRVCLRRPACWGGEELHSEVKFWRVQSRTANKVASIRVSALNSTWVSGNLKFYRQVVSFSKTYNIT